MWTTFRSTVHEYLLTKTHCFSVAFNSPKTSIKLSCSSTFGSSHKNRNGFSHEDLTQGQTTSSCLRYRYICYNIKNAFKIFQRSGYVVIYWVTSTCVCILGGIVYIVVAFSAKIKVWRYSVTENTWLSCQNIHHFDIDTGLTVTTYQIVRPLMAMVRIIFLRNYEQNNLIN